MKKDSFVDRRQFKRFKLSPMIIEPVQIKLPNKNETVPGIIVDISAGGMAIITYTNMPIGTQIDMAFNLLGLKIKELKTTVLRVKENYNTYLIIFKFDKLQKDIEKQIEEIAMDYEDCETKWIRGDKDICFKSCHYYMYCSKSIKK